MLRGVDISEWKNDLNVNAIAADFIVAKATGGTGFVDSFCNVAIQGAIAGGKKFGFYHYAFDGFNWAPPEQEANFFVDNCLGYFGTGIPILDWERGGNPNIGDVGWALAWLNQVYARTGVRPIIYMSLSVITEYDWSSVVAGDYGLWCAAYVDDNGIVPNYQMDPNRDPNPSWDGQVNDVLWQFTSTGRLDGYGGNLDCNFFYGTRETWDAYARATGATTTTTTQTPPEPTTTTTTTEAPIPPEPDPTTTTASTTESQPEPPITTTTTTEGQSGPNPGQSAWVGFWLGVGALWTAIVKWFKGDKS